MKYIVAVIVSFLLFLAVRQEYSEYIVKRNYQVIAALDEYEHALWQACKAHYEPT